VELVESGPVRAVLRVWSTYENSRLIQDYVLWEDQEQVELRLKLDWNERHKLLKMRYPLQLDPATTAATYEIPYGTTVRPGNGEEEPGQTWLDLSGRTPDGEVAGLSLLNDSKYSFSTLPTELAVTIARSPIYAHHDPAVPDPAMHYDYLDQGVQHVILALLPHSGDWRAAGAVRRAASLNARPVARFEHAHSGPLAATGSFVNIASPTDSVIMGALKRAEDGDGVILRLVETAGEPAQAMVHMPNWDRSIDTALGPNEIKTLFLPDDPADAVREVNLIEFD
jgi:alpha-mannosidase